MIHDGTDLVRAASKQNGGRMNRAQGVINIAFGTVKEKVLLVTACFLNFGSDVFRISKKLEFRIESGDKNNRSDGDTNGEAKNKQESQDNAKSNTKTGPSRKGLVLINLIVGHVFMLIFRMIHLHCLGTENGNPSSGLESANVKNWYHARKCLSSCLVYRLVNSLTHRERRC